MVDLPKIASPVGLLCRHLDYPERMAIVAPDGRILSKFAIDEKLPEITSMLRIAGYWIDPHYVVRRLAMPSAKVAG